MNISTLLFGILILFVTSCSTGSDKKQTEQEQSEINEKMLVYEPILVSDSLPVVVDEQSGMIWHDSLIWVNNDSGGAAALYAYNLQGSLKKTLQVKNVSNLDWEALAEDDQYFYIGDFGNNYGTRRNLKLYRVDKSKIDKNDKIETEAEEIGFEWADQKVFISLKHHHNYDCEAFFSSGDSLYFFTKNWANLKTRMYSMPKTLEQHKLQPKAEFDADLLVTGADINTTGDVVALVGYKDFRTYLILLYDFEATDFLGGKSVKLDLEVLGSAQTEGVLFTDNDELYINTEATKQKQAIYKIDWKQFISN
ncbi:hypothetical protein [Marinifilum caeruleilacunae]|uniref:Uncharacterized protein n=1 Tax=Marinifilum caeruleilacunae TaxID=2499076 RepID=A0ABX1WTC4_9BACT|nr:hypothetical protein [Marinifilum caeruleilacunae]NOU59257.1 hypothetical protein [Marinifilum caeruleilacunae]